MGVREVLSERTADFGWQAQVWMRGRRRRERGGPLSPAWDVGLRKTSSSPSFAPGLERDFARPDWGNSGRSVSSRTPRAQSLNYFSSPAKEIAGRFRVPLEEKRGPSLPRGKMGLSPPLGSSFAPWLKERDVPSLWFGMGAFCSDS